MSNFAQQYSTAPSRKSDEEKETEVADTDQVAKLASEDSVATMTHAAAGVSNGTPQQPAIVDAIGLLVRTVKEFEQSNRRAAAAGVSASMRQTAPHFNVRETEYRTFRGLIEAAEKQGLISTTLSGSDVDLHTVGGAPTGGPLKRLDNKLWRSFLEWNPAAVSSFDRASKHVVPGTSSDSSQVAIPPIPQSEQVNWMTQFTEELGEGPERDTLLAALRKENPAKAFSIAIRSEEGTERKWRSFLQKRVLDRAQDWARENHIPLDDLDDTTGKGAGIQPPHHVRHGNFAEAEMRERILTILGAMPLSELLRLPIPVEYTLLR